MVISWLFFALSGYLLLAFSGVADKFLVSKVVKQPIAYAFYTAITGPFSLILIPFGVKFLSWPDFAVALMAGPCFILAIYHSYSAISRSSVSRVVPIQGGLVPLFSFFLAHVILGEQLTFLQTGAFFFLVLGAVLISFRKEKGKWTNEAFTYAATSALFFALTSVLTKYIFLQSNYISGLVWPSLGFLLPVPFILMIKENREAIFNAPKEAGVKNTALYYSSRASGTLGGFLQKYAVSVSSVTLVNALQGTQFVFLLAMTTFVSIYFPKVLKERINAETIALKLTAIVLISCGLFLLLK